MIFICILTLFLSFSLTKLEYHIALKKSIIDTPNERSLHINPTPRGGGVAVVVLWFGGLIYLYDIGDVPSSLFFALLSGIPLAIVGFIDDVKALKPWPKLVIQILVSALAIYFLGGLQIIEFGIWTIKIWWILTFMAFIGIIWSINIFNFLDGIDGYVGTEIIFIGISLFWLFHAQIGFLLVLVFAGFLFWNWQKAKIFMGDNCSTLMGFNVAVLAIFYQNWHITSLSNFLILTSVFWFDANITLFRRWRNNENLTKAHRKHAYQRIVIAGFSHQKTVLFSLLLNIVGLVLVWVSIKNKTFDWLFLIIDLIILVFVLIYVDKQCPFECEKLPSENKRQKATHGECY